MYDNVNVNKFALSNVSFLIVWRWNSEGTEAKPSYDYVSVRERLAQGLPLCISDQRGLYRYHQWNEQRGIKVNRLTFNIQEENSLESLSLLVSQYVRSDGENRLSTLHTKSSVGLWFMSHHYINKYIIVSTVRTSNSYSHHFCHTLLGTFFTFYLQNWSCKSGWHFVFKLSNCQE